ncbi:MAG: hypothetical protein GVY18_13785 [Bacteroidetes bacterium]|nr:hypothetical protein [Bacteroidota bacterium]
MARRGLLWLIILAAIGVGGAAAFTAMQRAVLQHRAATGPIPFDVRFVATPAWMPNQLQRRILRELTPQMNFNDEQICAEVHSRGTANPWLDRVAGVRRQRTADGTRGLVRVRATFRQPVAAIRHDGRIGFVDARGVLLPFHEVPRWAARDRDGALSYHLSERTIPRGVRPLHIHYILVDGVAAPPPPVGKVWLGDDLQDGLRLVQMLKLRPYGNQVTTIDVRNHHQRVSDTLSEITVFAQAKHGGRQSRRTRILFGRFPHPEGDWVITPQRKLTYLDRYAERNNGRIAGVDETVDLRHDNLIVSQR